MRDVYDLSDCHDEYRPCHRPECRIAEDLISKHPPGENVVEKHWDLLWFLGTGQPRGRVLSNAAHFMCRRAVRRGKMQAAYRWRARAGRLYLAGR